MQLNDDEPDEVEEGLVEYRIVIHICVIGNGRHRCLNIGDIPTNEAIPIRPD